MIHFYHWPDWVSLDKKSLRLWLVECCRLYDVALEDVSYTFLENSAMEKLNWEFLKHAYPTDIITFDYSSDGRIRADIYIGHEVVQENADELGIGREDELCRVLMHGLLHTIGFDDHDKEALAVMRQNEDNCLLLRPKKLKNK